MIIGFDASRAFNDKKTGTENYSYNLLKALAKIDRKNKYIVYLRPGSKIGNHWPLNFQFSVLNFQYLWTQAGLALQTFIDRLDILFVPAHTLPLIRRPGLKTVVTVHDLGFEYLPQMHQLKQQIYLGFMQKHQLKDATKIIAVSEATKQDLVKRIGLDSKKIEVIYEGFDQKLFKPIRDDLLINTLMQYNLKPKTYYLFVGTVQPRKNLERIIKAFAKLESRIKNQESRKKRFGPLTLGTSHLVIAGSKGWMSDEIYKLPKKLGIEHQVKFLGYVPDEKLPALYSGAIALVFPSLFEGFGLPIIEAQSCGCPVITSNVSSMPEVAGLPIGEGAILVDPYSIDDIVEGMKRIKNQESRIKIIKAGFENIKRFSWEKCAARTLEVFEEVL